MTVQMRHWLADLAFAGVRRPVALAQKAPPQEKADAKEPTRTTSTAPYTDGGGNTFS